MSEVADLFATLGLKLNAGQWAQGDAVMGRAQRMADELGRRFMGAGAALRGVPGGLHATGEAAEGAGNKARAAAAGFDYLGTAIKGYLIGLGTHFAYDKLIAANQEFEDRTISLTAILQSGLSVSFGEAQKQAAGLNQEFQRFDQSGAPAKLSEIAEFGKNVSASVFAAGGKMKDLIEITEQGVIASKVLAGDRGPGYAALELSEMLLGRVSQQMKFQKLLLAQIHMSEEEFRELDEKQRITQVKRALNAPALNDAKAAFANSFSGIETTVVSKLEIMAREVGEKLFASLKESMKGFIAWLDANDAKIRAFGEKLSNVLVSGFNAVTKSVQFLAEHTTLLKAIFVTLGAVMAATAVRAVVAWIAFLGPIGLIVAALTGLAYLVVEYWDDISEAAGNLWKGIKDGASDLWDALKAGWKAAVDFILNLPGIAELRDIMGWTEQHSAASRDQATKDAETMTPAEWGQKHPGYDTIPELTNYNDSKKMLPADRSSGGPVAMNVDVGGISVNAPNADPVAVADQVNATIAEHLGNVMRRTMDEVA